MTRAAEVTARRVERRGQSLRFRGACHWLARLRDGDLRRIAAWIDLNAVFFGGYLPGDIERAQRGEPLAMPSIQ